MNLLREEFCKETNTPMGLDNVYNYVKWLENKWQQQRSYSEEEVKNMINDYDASQILFNEKYTYNEWFEQFKKK